MKENVVFWRDWDDAIRTLPESEQAEAYRAVMDYAMKDQSYAGAQVGIKMLLQFLIPRIDEQKEKYNSVCERNRINGAKGGRPRKPNETQENPLGFLGSEKNPTKPNETQENPNKPDKDIIISSSTTVKSDNNNLNNNIIYKDKSKKIPKKVSMKDLLVKAGCPEQLASDYMAIRERRKAPSTKTAFEGIEREVRKAGISMGEAIRECIERNWVGFRADWYNRAYNRQPQPQQPAQPEESEFIRQKKAEAERQRQEESERLFKDMKHRYNERNNIDSDE